MRNWGSGPGTATINFAMTIMRARSVRLYLQAHPVFLMAPLGAGLVGMAGAIAVPGEILWVYGDQVLGLLGAWLAAHLLLGEPCVAFLVPGYNTLWRIGLLRWLLLYVLLALVWVGIAVTAEIRLAYQLFEDVTWQTILDGHFAQTLLASAGVLVTLALAAALAYCLSAVTGSRWQGGGIVTLLWGLLWLAADTAAADEAWQAWMPWHPWSAAVPPGPLFWVTRLLMAVLSGLCLAGGTLFLHRREAALCHGQ